MCCFSGIADLSSEGKSATSSMPSEVGERHSDRQSSSKSLDDDAEGEEDEEQVGPTNWPPEESTQTSPSPNSVRGPRPSF